MRSDHNFEVARDQEVSELVKIVVADTSPLNYLLLIDCAFLLPALYRRILAPPSVIVELRHIDAPPVVASWAAELPNWIEVRSPTTLPDAELGLLDVGERDAIQVAIELNGATVLIDEFQGRREAGSRGLPVIGTLGVLRDAQAYGLIDARDALHRLIQETTFRVTDSLPRDFLVSLSSIEKKQ